MEQLSNSLVIKSTDVFPVSLLLFSVAMFYVIALAGAHKRVINQLREQLVMVPSTITIISVYIYLFDLLN